MDRVLPLADIAARPLVDSLADAINHEFRNPLASLLGHLELVRDAMDDLPIEVQVSLDAMDRAGQRLSELVTAAADLAEVTQAPLPCAV